jgi:hypothetical protein
MDDVNESGVSFDRFNEAIDFLESDKQNAAVFSNQAGTYYDMWTLRHKDLCPGDIWEEVMNYVHKHKVSDEEAYANTFAHRVFSLDQSHEMLEVDSAFGGFGIYKLSFALENKNPYLGSKVKALSGDSSQTHLFRWEVCEHVQFNIGIRNMGGRLFIKPNLINSTNSGVGFPASAFRQFIF